MKIYFKILVLILLFASCKKRIFDIKDNVSDLNLYCFKIKNPPEVIKPYTPVLDNGFLIESDLEIKEIFKSLKGAQIDTFIFPSYKIYVTKDNELYFNLSFNHDFSIIMSAYGNFKVDPNVLLKHYEDFEDLRSYNLFFNSIKSAQQCISVLTKERVFIPRNPRDSIFEWERYHGVVEMVRFNINSRQVADIENQIISELQDKTLPFKIVGYKSNSDSTVLTMYVDSMFSVNVPNYKILENYKTFESINFEIFETDSLRIMNICRMNNIEIDSIVVRKY